MQLFKYIVQDKDNKTRIGYIEGDEPKDLAERFLQGGAKKIIDIATFQLVNLKLLEHRKFFTFSGIKEGSVLEGSIEHVSELDAYKELREEYHILPSILVEGIRDIKVLKDTYEKRTEELKKKYDILVKNKVVQEKTKEFFEKPKEDSVVSLLDKEFKDILLRIQKDTEGLLLDKNYQEDVESIHTTIKVLLSRPKTSITQKFDFLSYILRELSFVEDTIDNVHSREIIKKLLTVCVRLLQKLEQSKLKNEPKREEKQEKTILRDTSVIKQNTSSTDTGTRKEESQDKDVEILKFKQYQDKKELVKSISTELDILRSKATHNADIDVSTSSTFLHELPLLTEFLVLLYSVSVLLGENFMIKGQGIQLLGVNISAIFGSIVLSTLSIKIVLGILLLHTLLLLLQSIGKHPRTQQILSTAFACVFISILYFF